MHYTRTVKPNKNLKTMLEEHPKARTRFEQIKDNQITQFFNAFADLYAEDPKDAFEAWDLILKSRGRAPLRTASI